MKRYDVYQVGIDFDKYELLPRKLVKENVTYDEAWDISVDKDAEMKVFYKAIVPHEDDGKLYDVIRSTDGDDHYPEHDEMYEDVIHSGLNQKEALLVREEEELKCLNDSWRISHEVREHKAA